MLSNVLHGAGGVRGLYGSAYENRSSQFGSRCSCCSTKKEEAPYSKPLVPDDSASATGVNRLFQPGFMEPVIHLINVSPNLVATEAAIGIVQNLTSDNYKSSIYLRAHIR